MNVVLASSNPGKLAELTVLLAPLGVALSLQQQLGVSDADETATTFVENALIKARHAAAATRQAAIADDSGLVVLRSEVRRACSPRGIRARTAMRQRTTAN